MGLRVPRPLGFQVGTYSFKQRQNLAQETVQALRRSQTLLERDLAELLRRVLALLRGFMGMPDKTAAAGFNKASWVMDNFKKNRFPWRPEQASGGDLTKDPMQLGYAHNVGTHYSTIVTAPCCAPYMYLFRHGCAYCP